MCKSIKNVIEYTAMGPFWKEQGRPASVERVSNTPLLRDIVSSGLDDLLLLNEMQYQLLETIKAKHSPSGDLDDSQLVFPASSEKDNAVEFALGKRAIEMQFKSRTQNVGFLYPTIHVTTDGRAQTFVTNSNGTLFPCAIETKKRKAHEKYMYVSRVGISLESVPDNTGTVYPMFGDQTRELAERRQANNIVIYTDEAFEREWEPDEARRKARRRPFGKQDRFSPNETKIYLPDGTAVTLRFHEIDPLSVLERDHAALDAHEKSEFVADDVAQQAKDFRSELDFWSVIYRRSIQPPTTGETVRLL